MNSKHAYNEDMKFTFVNTNRIKIKSFYRKTINTDFFMLPHSHEYVEVMNVLSGNCYLEVYNDGKLVRNEKVAPNTLIIISSNQYHKIHSEGEVLIQNLEFETIFQDEKVYVNIIGYLKDSPEWKKICDEKIVILPDYNNISNTINNIIDRIQKIGIVNNDVYLDSSVFHFFVKLCDLFKNNYISTNSITYHTKKTIEIIQHNLTNDISVKKIADMLNISVSYLERIFKQSMNMTVKKFIHLLKLDLVRDSLVNSNVPIETIMHKYAYENIAQLNYQFKKFYNQTPLSYRKNYYKKEIFGTDDKYESSTLK